MAWHARLEPRECEPDSASTSLRTTDCLASPSDYQIRYDLITGHAISGDDCGNSLPADLIPANNEFLICCDQP